MNDSPVQKTNEISILGFDDTSVDRDRDGGKRLVRRTVSVETLENEVESFLAAMERIIGNLSQQVGNYEMNEITVSAEVNASGKVSLFGTGGEVGGKGGLSFKFKRSNTQEPG